MKKFLNAWIVSIKHWLLVPEEDELSTILSIAMAITMVCEVAAVVVVMNIVVWIVSNAITSIGFVAFLGWVGAGIGIVALVYLIAYALRCYDRLEMR